MPKKAEPSNHKENTKDASNRKRNYVKAGSSNHDSEVNSKKKQRLS